MKALIGLDLYSYSFDASEKTVTFAGFTPKINQLFLIFNATKQTMIYNFASASLGGTLAGQVLTLTYNTASHSDSDLLMILYEIGEPHIDFDLGAVKYIDLNPIWNRYSDYETLVSEQNLTNAYADYGAEIDMRGYTHLGIFLSADVNNSENVYLKALAKYENAATDEMEIDDISEIALWTTGASDFKKYYEFDVGVIPYIQLQAYAGTVGATAGDLTVYIVKFYRP